MADLLNHLSGGLNFPGYFGSNWNALSDCLRDLYWVEGLVVLEHADIPALDRGDLLTYLEILDDAVSSYGPDEQPSLRVRFPAESEDEVRAVLEAGASV